MDKSAASLISLRTNASRTTRKTDRVHLGLYWSLDRDEQDFAMFCMMDGAQTMMEVDQDVSSSSSVLSIAWTWRILLGGVLQTQPTKCRGDVNHRRKDRGEKSPGQHGAGVN